jgi:membrane-associated phospholipid phosphatase
MLAQIVRANGTELLGELDSLDRAVYAAVARSRTPELDRFMARLSDAANYSRLSLASAAALVAGRGEEGREAAKLGLVSVAATAAVVNIVIKPLGRRERPDPSAHRVPSVRRVRVPKSRSWPSGHTAAAFAFATGVSDVLPWEGGVLHLLATVVGYSRVHTGVHYPSDVIVGALTGTIVSRLVVDRLTPGPERDGREGPQADPAVLG